MLEVFRLNLVFIERFYFEILNTCMRGEKSNWIASVSFYTTYYFVHLLIKSYDKHSYFFYFATLETMLPFIYKM